VAGVNAFEKLQQLQQGVQELNDAQIDIRVSEETTAAFTELALGIEGLQETTGAAVEGATAFSEQLGALAENVTDAVTGFAEMATALDAMKELQFDSEAFEGFTGAVQSLVEKMSELDTQSGATIERIAELAETMSGLVSNVNNAVTGLAGVSQALKDMEFSVDADSFGKFATEFEKLVKLVVEFQSQIGGAVGEASGFADELKTFVDNVVSAVKSLSELSVALEGIEEIELDSSSLDGLESKIQAIANALNAFSASATDSVKSANEFLGEINNLVSGVNQAATGISDLADALQQVEKIDIDSSTLKGLVDKIAKLSEELLRFGASAQGSITKAGEFAATMNAMVGAVAGAIAGLKEINSEFENFDFRLDASGFAAFENAITNLADKLNRFGDSAGEAIESANDFAATMNDFTGNILGAITNIEALSEKLENIGDVEINTSDLDTFLQKVKALALELTDFETSSGKAIAKAGGFAAALVQMTGDVVGAVENLQALSELLSNFDVSIEAGGLDDVKRAFAGLAEEILALDKMLDGISPKVKEIAAEMATLTGNFLDMVSSIADAVDIINNADFDIDKSALDDFGKAVETMVEKVVALAPTVSGASGVISEFADLVGAAAAAVSSFADAVEIINLADWDVDPSSLDKLEKAFADLFATLRQISDQSDTTLGGLVSLTEGLKDIATNTLDAAVALAELGDAIEEIPEFEVNSAGLQEFENALSSLADWLEQLEKNFRPAIEAAKVFASDLDVLSESMYGFVTNLSAAVDLLRNADFTISIEGLEDIKTAFAAIAETLVGMANEVAAIDPLFQETVAELEKMSQTIVGVITDIAQAIALLKDIDFSIDDAALERLKDAFLQIATTIIDMGAELETIEPKFQDTISNMEQMSRTIIGVINGVTEAVELINSANFDIDPGQLEAFKNATLGLTQSVAELGPNVSAAQGAIDALAKTMSQINEIINGTVSAIQSLNKADFSIDPTGIDSFKTAMLELTEIFMRLGPSVDSSQADINKFAQAVKDITGAINGMVKAVETMNTADFSIDDEQLKAFSALMKKLGPIINSVVEVVKTLATSLGDLGGAMGRVETFLRSTGEYMRGTLVGALQSVRDGFGEVKSRVDALTNTNSTLATFESTVGRIATNTSTLSSNFGALEPRAQDVWKVFVDLNAQMDAFSTTATHVDRLRLADSFWKWNEQLKTTWREAQALGDQMSYVEERLRAAITATNDYMTISKEFSSVRTAIEANRTSLENFRNELDALNGKTVDVYVNTHYSDADSTGSSANANRVARWFANA